MEGCVELMDKLHQLQQKDTTIEKYQKKIELLLMKAGIREELRITIARFQSGLRYEFWDRVELLPYNDMNDLVHMWIRVKQQLMRKTSSTKEYPNMSSSQKEGGIPLQIKKTTRKKKEKEKPLEK